MKKILKKYNPIAPYVIYSIVILFLLTYIQKIDFNNLHNVNINWVYLITSLLFGLMARFWYATIWIILISFFAKTNISKNVKNLYLIFIKSYITRYIPGTIPWVAIRINLTSKLNISKAKLTSITIFETFFQIITFLIISTLIIASYLDYIYTPLILLTIAVCAIIAITTLRVFIKYLAPLVNKIINIDLYCISISKKNIVFSVMMSSVSLILTGLSFVFCTLSIADVGNISNVVYCLGISALSISVGMLSFLTPGGIGVRESIQLFFLSTLIKPELALIAVIICRINEIVCDILFLVPSFIIRIPKPKITQ